MSDRLTQILEFFEAIEPFHKIERSTYLSDLSRPESDSNHTWHMAMLALLLGDEMDFDIDLCKVLRLVLVHDLCEIYGGDTFAHLPEYGDREKERQAAEKLFAASDVQEAFSASYYLHQGSQFIKYMPYPGRLP